MARLVVKNGRQNDTFYYDIGLCGEKCINHSRFNIEYHWGEGEGGGGCLITKKKESLHFDLLKFLNLMKLEITI